MQIFTEHDGGEVMLLLKKVFSNMLKVIGSPIYRHPIFAIFFFGLLVVPSLFCYCDLLLESNTLWRIFIIICPELLATVCLCFIIELSRKLNNAIYWTSVVISHLIVYLVSFVNCFLSTSFSCLVNPYVILLVKQSSLEEASNFVSTYLMNVNFMCLIFSYMVVLSLECVLLFHGKFIHNRIDYYMKTFPRMLKSFFSAVVLLPLCLAFVQLDSLVFCVLPGAFAFLPGVYDNLIVRNIRSFLQYESDDKSFSKCADFQSDISVELCDVDNSDIVLIVGESFNKYHSSLYGYNKETNPRLREKNVFVFDNVISCVNYTFMSFRKFLSFSSMDGVCEWNQSPLFPCAFKQVGYNVVFESNQFVKDVNMQIVDASCAFLFHPEIEPKMIDYRNQYKYQFDEELIDSYKVLRDSIEKTDRPNLIIFHLNGQHFDAKKKYPPGRSFFKEEDYVLRDELSSIEREYVANYDNATLYNDSIVSEIIEMYRNKDAIILYFSDHGEEVFDYRSHVGRTSSLYKSGAPALHCQLDIPFLIYTTEKYQDSHKNNVERIKRSIHRPFMIDDLPHLLFDLAGMRSVWFDPQRSVINDSYNIHRKRLVCDYGGENSYDYDSICSAYGPWKIGWQK